MAQVIDKVAFALHSPHATLSCCRKTTTVHAFAQTLKKKKPAYCD